VAFAKKIEAEYLDVDRGVAPAHRFRE